MINKNITEAELISAVRDALLPAGQTLSFISCWVCWETDDDLLGIVHLVQQVLNTYKQAGGKGRPQITVSASVLCLKRIRPFNGLAKYRRQKSGAGRIYCAGICACPEYISSGTVQK